MRTINWFPRALVAAALAWTATWCDTRAAAAEPRAPAPSAAIKSAEEAAKVLGQPAAARSLGEPLPGSAELAKTLAQVHTDPGDLPQLQVQVDGKTLDLPLEHTHVAARITGHVARVEVKQTYQNPFAYPIEAIYVFPLPENSAVDAMKMVIGERVIVAEIKKRDEARRVYDEAKQQGHTAALLEQERPNIFTQSVANIEPGSTIDVVIAYAQTLTYDAGGYEFVFPMVVGPRFVPGNPTGHAGSGWSPDTDLVPDASRITPPLIGGGQRSGHDISLELTVDAGLPIRSWTVPTHDVDERDAAKGQLSLKLAAHDALPNRDFVLQYAVDGKQAQATLLTHFAKQNDGTFALIVQPPTLDVDELVGQREIVFVVDVSGSMFGVPLSMCKDAMEEALRRLRPVDTFNIITFAGATAKLFSEAREANDANIKNGLAFVSGMRAGGGTLMADGVTAALSPEVGSGRHRYVFFLTDGYVGNEAQIIGLVKQFNDQLSRKQQRARVFGFGVGSSVNRHLLDGIATAGDGLTVYASTREDPLKAVNAFYHVIDRAVMTGLQVDWGDLRVSEVFPKVLPDLFASRPLVLHGKLRGDGRTTITVSGRVGRRLVELPVEVELDRSGQNAVLDTLWARAKVAELERDLAYNGNSPATLAEITEVGLAYHLVTRMTSLVAVDRSKKVSGEAKTIVQPVEVPEGVDASMAAPAQALMGRHASRGYGGPPMAAEAAASPSLDGAPPSKMRRPSPVYRQPERERRDSVATATPAAPVGLVSDLRVQGSLDAQAIHQLVAQRRAALETCWRDSGVGAAGTVEVRFFVAPDGKVLQVRVRGRSLTDAGLLAKLTAEIKRWKLPAPRSGDTVEVRFTLQLGR